MRFFGNFSNFYNFKTLGVNCNLLHTFCFCYKELLKLFQETMNVTIQLYY